MSAAREPAGAPLSLGERDRRWAGLQELLGSLGCDALIVAANDHRGHKGALRYVSDYALYYRHGFAFVAPGAAPLLVLPENFRDNIRSGWVGEHRFAPNPAAELVALLRPLPRRERVGVVGLHEILRAGDHQRLVESLPESRFVDVSREFDRLRAHKSAEELACVEAAGHIADACFERLLHLARPGKTELELSAALLETCTRLGAEETLFLCMGLQGPDGKEGERGERGEGSAQRAYMGPPRERALRADEAFAFSIELTGPGGYWVEFCRMLTFGAVSDSVREGAAMCVAGLDAAAAALRPGAALAEVHGACAAAIDAERFDLGRALGHSIGQDVVEAPLILRDSSPADIAGSPMAFAMHPRFKGRHLPLHLYMADTFILDGAAARRISRWPLRVFTETAGG